jgi:hypothetical protein
MTESDQLSHEKTQLTRRGKTLYEANPSIAGGRFRTKITPARTATGQKAYMISPNTGEVIGEGTFGFVEERELDSEQFVKVYLEGIKQYGQLSKAGASVFEVVYRTISGASGKDKDTVTLSYFIAQRWNDKLTRRTYERGMNELLEKEFLYRSLAADTYFVNVNFMFNGDRMVVVRQYRRVGSSLQTELPFSTRQLPKAVEGSD